MRSNKLVKLLVAVLVFIPAVTIAAEGDSVKEPINLKGKFFMDWTNNYESKNDGVDQDDAYNTFKVERIYLTWKKKLDDIFSIRITTDIQKTQDAEGVSGERSGTKGYNVYAKYAYLQGEKKFGDLEFITMIGLTKTTAIGFVDDRLTGVRWLNNNFIDKSKKLIGTSIDSSADLGVNVGFKYAKLVELQAAYVNGEGYKKAHEDNYEEDDGKQVSARLTVIPLKGLYVTGYYSNNDTSKKSSTGDNFIQYYGGGIAWADDMLKIGANYLIVKEEQASVDQGDMWLLDSWLKFDMNSLVQVPVFLYGRYAVGENKDVDNSKKTYIGAGVGYNYSKNLQVALYYNQLEQDTINETKESQLQLKAQVKF